MTWAQIWRIARRDLSGRFRGLRLLIICLFLGVATLATIGSLTASITGELSQRGQVILGGDFEVTMSQRLASEAELAAFEREGLLSETVRMQAMAQRTAPRASGSGPDAILAELKGVDYDYPLYGTMTLQSGKYAPLDPASTVIGAGLADRLDLKRGDKIRFGDAEFTITGIIADEPDRLGEGFTLGPVALVSDLGIQRTGLIQPGSMYEAKYRVKVGPLADPAQSIARLKAEFPEAGLELRDRDRGAPGTARFIERMGQFLSLVGLAALVIAGIGVGNGVASYLATKRQGIATLKILGAGSGDILRIYLVQILAVSALAILGGLIAGALIPPAIIAAAGDVLPVKPGFAIYPRPLAVSAAYGLLIAFIFALPPLARARHVPAAGLFRSLIEGNRWPDRATLIAVGIGIAGIVTLALVTAREAVFSAWFMAAATGVLLMLAGIGWAIRWTASRLPRPKAPLLRLALANLHRPGAQTGQLVVALGLGLTLFVILAGIQTSLTNEITRTVPKEAPNLFVLDVPVAREAEFRRTVEQAAPGAAINAVPSLRGTVTGYKNIRVADLKDIPENAWVLRGERGLTYAETLPEGSELIEGKWWPKGYEGPPLVSIDREMANVLDLKVGDSLTVSLLGREFTARIASLRQINWDTMGFNYVMVFSPNTLRDAPHNLAATVSLKGMADADVKERAVSKAVLAGFASSSVIEVRDVIGQVTTILTQIATAIAAAGSIAILSGIAVLIGAIAASRQARIYDSVILKTLGATRRQILSAQALEYGLLAALLALVALALGLTAAWYVITQIFSFNWAPDWPVVMLTLAGGALLTLGLGIAGSLPVLAARPARALRQL
ncbi:MULTISPECIES: FtsX-like permease family protein [Pseudomonadota]|jgi:putative ABC transport system permease protein|uniref:ABC transporter permease n=1 Tax=Pseudomonadota TaxID=1224 RepID=UPI00076A58BC|nr:MULTISPECIES: FtsX-like permease family protein [Sphingomonadales]MAF63455.1 ABC transporter permease [Blastomonas sp.]|tara:strand:+ start:5447 stop:7978 length:2532 start_codon:yes stop_codon:yes gene_type:complete